jgi:hypothetical protein
MTDSLSRNSDRIWLNFSGCEFASEQTPEGPSRRLRMATAKKAAKKPAKAAAKKPVKAAKKKK